MEISCLVKQLVLYNTNIILQYNKRLLLLVLNYKFINSKIKVFTNTRNAVQKWLLLYILCNGQYHHKEPLEIRFQFHNLRTETKI